jgi:hypothetical protein
MSGGALSFASASAFASASGLASASGVTVVAIEQNQNRLFHAYPKARSKRQVQPTRSPWHLSSLLIASIAALAERRGITKLLHLRGDESGSCTLSHQLTFIFLMPRLPCAAGLLRR